jgi:ABC-2 type transport system permease protein
MSFKWHRVEAVIWRQIYLFPKSFDRMTDLFFWPLFEVLTWGLATQWIAGASPLSQQLVLSILTALVFWRVVWVVNYEIGVNLLEECWNRNFTNIVSTPLRKSEWLTANVIVGVLKAALTIFVLAVAIWIGSHLNIFQIGWGWIPLISSLMVSGYCFGFMAAGMVLRLGIRAQALTWTLTFLFAPVSAVYYPLSYLPDWAQMIAVALPTTYIFEGLRTLILEGRFDTTAFAWSVGLNCVYLVLTLWYFNRAFEAARERGFDHLE